MSEAKFEPEVTQTPLLILGSSLEYQPFGLSDLRWQSVETRLQQPNVTRAILENAFIHVEQRLRQTPSHTHRGRATQRWLGTWAKRIDAELERRRAALP